MLRISRPPPTPPYDEWKELTAPVEVPVVETANSDDAGHAEPRLLALHRGARELGGGARVVQLERGHGDRSRAPQRTAITARTAYPWRRSPTITPERAGQRDRDQQQQEDLEQVAERVRVLERVRGVGVVEATAVGAELLDRLLRGDRPAGDRLVLAEQRGGVVAGGQVLHRAHGHQQRSPRRRPAAAAPGPAPRVEVDPEVADPVGARRGRSRGSGPPRRRGRRRPRRSSAPPGRPSARGGPSSTRPSRPASWCW